MHIVHEGYIYIYDEGISYHVYLPSIHTFSCLLAYFCLYSVLFWVYLFFVLDSGAQSNLEWTRRLNMQSMMILLSAQVKHV